MSDSQRIFHFVFGLKLQTDPFHLVHYLCLESCRQVNRPDVIFFHYRHLPHGPYWDKIAPHLTLCPVAPETHGFDKARYADTAEGIFIQSNDLTYAHESDFIRLQALKERGGVYADMDTLFVNPYLTEWFGQDCVLGEESPIVNQHGLLQPSLCNAVIFSKPNGRFVEAWSELAVETFNGTWSQHSCQLASQLWKSHTDDLHVVPQNWFYRFRADKVGIEGIFTQPPERTEGIFSIHLWAHLWWSENRRDFTDFHAGLIDEAYMKHANTTYATLGRRFV